MRVHGGPLGFVGSLLSFVGGPLSFRWGFFGGPLGCSLGNSLEGKYRISANSCRDNYSFLELKVRQVFKGGNYCFLELHIVIN